MKKLLQNFNDIIYTCDIQDKKNVIKTFMNMLKLIENKKYNVEINNVNNHIKNIMDIIKDNTCNSCNTCNNCIKKNNNLIFINFIEYKNKLLIKDIVNLDSYNNLINNILNKYNNKFEIKTSDNIVKNALDKLLLDNIYSFNGNWDIIICNSNGYPKKIELLDPIKLNKMYEYIQKLSNVK
jgi:hypothetical protein